MFRTSKGLFILFGCALVVVGGGYFGFSLTHPTAPLGKPNVQNQIGAVAPTATTPPTDEPTATSRLPEIEMPEDVRINANTQMVYEYHYTADDRVEVSEEKAPYFLYSKTKTDMASYFNGWDIVRFTPETVVVRKEIEGKSHQYYIIGVQDGYVAVFYKDRLNGSNLKEVTDTPVRTLPLEEQARLKEGIPIEGDDNLIRLLQDYGS